MKNKILKIGGGSLALSLLPMLAFADEMSTSTADSILANVYSGVSQSIVTNVTIILGIVAGLLALGWGYRKFKSKVSGRKF